METFIRKSLGMKDYLVTRMIQTGQGWGGRVEGLSNRRLKCSQGHLEVKRTRGRLGQRSWKDLSLRAEPFWITYGPFLVRFPRCGLKPIIDFARLINDHLPGMLAWTKLRISNGTLEGMNNKIKLVSHRSFGLQKTEHFISSIHCCADSP